MGISYHIKNSRIKDDTGVLESWIIYQTGMFIKRSPEPSLPQLP